MYNVNYKIRMNPLKKTYVLNRKELKEGDVLISLTNTCNLTKGKEYTLHYTGIYYYVINNKGDRLYDYNLINHFVKESDAIAYKRSVNLNKLGL